MADAPAPSRSPNRTGAEFNTTIWSVVLAAGDATSPAARDALERLCSTYWFPIYAFLRRRGHSPADAEDLVQGFFASLLAHDSLASVLPERGRFRSFLLASLRNFVGDQRDRERALKRGGGRIPISLQAETAEATYAAQVTDGDTPERCFDRQWAQSLFLAAQNRLRHECRRPGREPLYDALGPELTDDTRSPHAEIASRLSMSENAVRVAAHRLRQRYQEIVREIILETVDRPETVNDEIRHLLGVLAGSP